MDGLVDLVTFELLELIASTGTVTAAAAAMGISQQAASARLDRAERTLGVRLVTRGVGGSTLTEHGGMVLEWARPVLVAARRAETSLEALRDRDGSVVVAASQTIAEFPLPTWLQALHRMEPQSQVRLLSGNSADVVQQVRTGVARLGFIERPDVPPDLRSVEVGVDDLAVVVAPAHAWADRTVEPRELAATPLLIREQGSGTRATLEQWLGAHGAALTPPAAELGTASALRAAARAGVAPAVLSLRAVEDDLAAGRLIGVELGGAPIRRAFTAIWSSPTLEGAARAIVEVAISHERARGASGGRRLSEAPFA